MLAVSSTLSRYAMTEKCTDGMCLFLQTVTTLYIYITVQHGIPRVILCTDCISCKEDARHVEVTFVFLFRSRYFISCEQFVECKHLFPSAYQYIIGRPSNLSHCMYIYIYIYKMPIEPQPTSLITINPKKELNPIYIIYIYTVFAQIEARGICSQLRNRGWVSTKCV